MIIKTPNDQQLEKGGEGLPFLSKQHCIYWFVTTTNSFVEAVVFFFVFCSSLVMHFDLFVNEICSGPNNNLHFDSIGKLRKKKSEKERVPTRRRVSTVTLLMMLLGNPCQSIHSSIYALIHQP